MTRISEKQEEKRRIREQDFMKKVESYDYNRFKTKFLDSVLEQEIMNREERDRKEEEKREFMDKMKSYGEMVKEMHKPQISRRKQLEMKLIKERVTNPGRRPLHGSYSTQHLRKTFKEDYSTAHGSRMPNSEAEDSAHKRRKIIWPENPMKPPPKEPRVGVSCDWLKEQRMKRQEEEKDGRVRGSPKSEWKKDINSTDLSKKEKYELVRERVRVLEETAKRKEQILAVTKNGTIDQNDQVNDMIYESIKAKLSILDEFNS